MLKHFVLPIADLQQLIWKCSHCKTEILLDLTYTVQTEPPFRSHAPILFCASCEEQLESAVKDKIDAFRRAYQILKDAADSVAGFRIKVVETAAASADVTEKVT